MALLKDIRAENGLTLKYHRIWQLDIRVNECVGVWVRSYVSKPERAVEKQQEPGDLEAEVVYHSDCFYSTETPDGPMTVEAAYEWLKSERPEFAGAQNC